MKKLIRYPPGKRDTEFVVPNTVVDIELRAIDQNQYLEKLTINDIYNKK